MPLVTLVTLVALGLTRLPLGACSLRKQLAGMENLRSKAEAQAEVAKKRVVETGNGGDAEVARIKLGTVHEMEKRVSEIKTAIEHEMVRGGVYKSREKMTRAQTKLDEATADNARTLWKIGQADNAIAYAKSVVPIVNDEDELGRTAAYFAAEAGHLGVLTFLRENGGRGDMQDGAGRNLLMLAAMRNHRKLIKYLLSLDVRNLLHQTDLQGANALFIAAHQGNPDTVADILKRFTAVDRPAGDGSTPLFVASENGHLVRPTAAAAVSPGPRQPCVCLFRP